MMLPAMAMAAPPPPASGVSAVAEDGGVRVRWDYVEGQTRAHIYWSYISILENGGEYDDFAVMEGPSTEYLIDVPPAVDTLYVAIILENADGEESPFFTEEASIELGTAQNADSASSASQDVSSQQASASSAWSSQAESSMSDDIWDPLSSAASVSSAAVSTSSALPNDGKFHMLTAEAVSPNQVVLTFSHPVVMNVSEAARAFTVATLDGRQLALTRLELLAERVTLATDTQERGVTYVVTASSVVQGVQAIGAQQVAVAFPSLVESATFTGNAFGKEPLVPTAAKGFSLQAIAIGGGLYRIETQLTEIPHDGIARYDVYQSLDGGRTFSGPQSVEAAVPSIRVDGVAAGAFVMTLQPIALDGTPRSPLTASVTLGSGTPTPVVTSSSSAKAVSSAKSSSSSSGTTTRPPSTSLPGSGAGIVSLLGAGSAWTMIRVRRRRVRA